ncbi:3-oxoacyl-ACP synthase [Burkholderia contaminans FFH2055]|uniref:beta-ketoacyl-ACP synthase II n=2 Tax=Burkholderia contaminans TaxID=488447 RepID=UPI0006254DEC|nr:beta-ketoacyl-ACP synthase II [Burkholderia contaminans]KKL34025.1 3-oxoacyl-ACP synthase [Burkholderia contaminans FFH2055]MEB4632215.1 beta-ketoacyl-ACP synthase II [Burkholderia contaminans]MEB4639636.1 beta-ketoacyl-ACP synthase II [Burkholderia contaminans]MEB4654292.1 beta-ketoacyl-ACP synthase II [Burkholderia contaminans]MEB4663419.1 beta-ketoacyl-ACP synthase II [Burkholderia contaminans]
MSTRRIVVTGMGIVSPLGCGVESVWNRLLKGRSGLAGLPGDITEGIASKVGGVVPMLTSDCPWGFDPDLAVEPKDQKKMDRFSLFALAAAQEALTQAGWQPESEKACERTATIVASGVGGFGAIVDAVRITDNRGPRRLSPFTVPSFLANMAAGHISIRHGFRGPLGAPVTACAASAQAIGDAARLIRAGEADIAVCGGAEACIDRVSLGSFAAARTMSTGFNDHPAQASRPFDTGRDGFVMGEGAGMLVIETLEHALQRGATPIAEVLGYGTSADAHHMTSPPDDGAGGRRAMELAIRQANLDPGMIGHLNAHATSTPVGDISELAAIKAIFGTGRGPAVSATKSSTGHLLGAAGGVEAIFTVLALRDQLAPPTLNLTQPDSAAEGIDIVGGSPRKISTEYAISNGFGFGGVNASLVFRGL